MRGGRLDPGDLPLLACCTAADDRASALVGCVQRARQVEQLLAFTRLNVVQRQQRLNVIDRWQQHRVLNLADLRLTHTRALGGLCAGQMGALTQCAQRGAELLLVARVSLGRLHADHAPPRRSRVAWWSPSHGWYLSSSIQPSGEYFNQAGGQLGICASRRLLCAPITLAPPGFSRQSRHTARGVALAGAHRARRNAV